RRRGAARPGNIDPNRQKSTRRSTNSAAVLRAGRETLTRIAKNPGEGQQIPSPEQLPACIGVKGEVYERFIGRFNEETAGNGKRDRGSGEKKKDKRIAGAYQGQ
ncbi:MAG: hypothetical protein IIY46_02935, partial [Lachnospiraceae bacterium]|nr:hypothetical protein [Lachnospiraceae bacterium]